MASSEPYLMRSAISPFSATRRETALAPELRDNKENGNKPSVSTAKLLQKHDVHGVPSHSPMHARVGVEVRVAGASRECFVHRRGGAARR